MTQPQRRQFLLSSAALLLAGAQKVQDPDQGPSNPALQAIRAAGLEGRAALLIVDPAPQSQRDLAWRLLSDSGRAQELLPLAVCRLARASQEQIEAAIPRCRLPVGAWAVLIETDRQGSKDASWQVIQAQLAPLPDPARLQALPVGPRQEAKREAIQPLVQALASALLPDDKALARRARHNLGSLSEATLGNYKGLLQRGQVSQDGHSPLALGAWLLERIPYAEPKHVAPLRSQLADFVQSDLAELVATPAPQPGPVDLDFGGEHCPACGMGHVTVRGRSFLDHYTDRS